jgi:8-oxo-dGTP pyrophosphatase MutT (NUDIX family)
MSDSTQHLYIEKKVHELLSTLKTRGFQVPDAICDRPILSYDKFQSLKPQILHKCKQSAGALILNEDMTQIVLVRGKLSRKWGPPKGHREEFENDLQTMIREINEEIGCKISLKLPLLPYIISNKVKLYCIVIPKSTNLTINDTNEIGKIQWFNLENLENAIRDSPQSFNSSIRCLFKKTDPIKAIRHKATSFYHNYPLNTSRQFNEHLYKLRKCLHELIAFDSCLTQQESNYLYYYILQRLHNNIFLSTELLNFIASHF